MFIGGGVGSIGRVGGARRRLSGSSSPITLAIGLMGQSECVFIVSPGSNYNKLVENGFPLPANVPSGNLVLYTQEENGGAVVTTTVNQSNVNAGLVNPAMAAMACFLGHVRPGYVFHIGDLARSGTGRSDLADDTSNGADDRLWTDFTLVLNAVEAGASRSLDLLVECWYRNDIARITTFVSSFWPVYFGSTEAGANFTLGTVNAVTGRQVDHCIYDAQVGAASKGRGVLARSVTTWSLLTPMSDIFAYPVSPTAEATNFTAFSPFGAPVRQSVIDVTGNALAISTGITVGPSAHVMQFDVSGGTNGGPTHPTTANPDGQMGFMWPFAVAIARKAGLTINEPVYDSVQADPAGAWVDVYFTLPNGGNLTTWRILESRAAISSSVPHRQAVIGFEIGRSGTYRPVFNTAETGYDVNYRGTVTIADTGSGAPRKGRVRITPTTPFAFGDSIRYLAGGASAVLQTPRDIGVHADMLVETVPALRDVTATYPFPGLAIRPQQTDIAVPVAPPPFAARAVYFDGADYFANEAVSVPATGSLLASLWFRSNDSAWNATARRLYQFRVGTTTTFELLTASSGRLTLRLNNNTASDTLSFTADGGSTQFAINQWYHVMIAASGGTARVYVNNVAVGTIAYATLDQAGNNLTRMGVGAQSPGTSPWIGDIGHLWISPTQTLDLTVLANRQKFALAGLPVDLGANGQAPTGSAPEFYFDGAGAAWQNLGTVGSITAVGAVTASSGSPAY